MPDSFFRALFAAGDVVDNDLVTKLAYFVRDRFADALGRSGNQDDLGVVGSGRRARNRRHRSLRQRRKLGAKGCPLTYEGKARCREGKKEQVRNEIHGFFRSYPYFLLVQVAECFLWRELRVQCNFGGEKTKDRYRQNRRKGRITASNSMQQACTVLTVLQKKMRSAARRSCFSLSGSRFALQRSFLSFAIREFPWMLTLFYL